MPLIKAIYLFPNGNIAVTDENGEQIADLQRAPISLWCEHATSLGYNVAGLVVQTHEGNWRLFRTEHGWNREHVE